MTTIKIDAMLRAVTKLESRRQDFNAANEGLILGAIMNAKAAGATWQQIADALGVPLQTAHRKYSKLIDN